MDFEELAAYLDTTWGRMTLAEFREDAMRSETGTTYQSIRTAGGLRIILMVCVTDLDHIALLERGFDLQDDGADVDWYTFTLSELFKAAVIDDGVAFESLRDEYRRRSVLVMCAAEPVSTRKLCLAFGLSS